MKQFRSRRAAERGANLIEFTLVGIPIIFILISVFEVSRGMWLYQTAAHAAKETARFVVVHGINCETEACGRTIGQISTQLRDNFAIVDPAEVTVTFRAGCAPSSQFRSCSDVRTGTLAATMADNTVWPGQFGNDFIDDFVEVEIRFPFRSAIAMFWPGTGRGTVFGTVNMFAASREMVQF